MHTSWEVSFTLINALKLDQLVGVYWYWQSDFSLTNSPILTINERVFRYLTQKSSRWPFSRHSMWCNVNVTPFNTKNKRHEPWTWPSRNLILHIPVECNYELVDNFTCHFFKWTYMSQVFGRIIAYKLMLFPLYTDFNKYHSILFLTINSISLEVW